MGIRFYKFYILGICSRFVLDFNEIIKVFFEKFLIFWLFCLKGCNNRGVIISCYCGGGYKRLYCLIDFKCNKVGINGKVKIIEYDLNCKVCIVLLIYDDGFKSYILYL